MEIPNYLREEARRLSIRARYGRRRMHRAAVKTSPFGLFLSFLKIGTVGFGGGLAVIAQIRTLVVSQRRWLTDREFAEGFALAQSLPGTNAGNIITFVGLTLHGVRGAVASMVGFIIPSYLMMVGLAVAYTYVRDLPDTDRIFHGLNAAVVALILVTAWRIARRTLAAPWQWVIAGIALLTSIAGAATLEVIAGAGLFGLYMEAVQDQRRQRWRRLQQLAMRRRQRLAELEQRALAGPLADPRRTARSRSSVRSVALLALVVPFIHQLWLIVTLATTFFRVGAVTFGGGFVMIPIIEQSVVETHHWLTHQQFADATALGQITPGPVLITATFIGYKVAGIVGSLVATVAVFLPAFLMTLAAGSSLRRFQANAQVQAFLRGITPAVVGLLVAAAWGIGRAGIHSWVGISIAVVALAVLLKFRVNAVVVIFGAGLARFLASVWLGF